MATVADLQAQFAEVLAADQTLAVKIAESNGAAAALTSAQGAADTARASAEVARADLSAKVSAFKSALDELAND